MATHKTKAKFIALIASVFLLTACGFHLRGQNELPPELKNLYLQSSNPYGQLELILKNTLDSMGVNLADSPQGAPVTLNIIRADLSHDNPNVVSSDQATIYNFTNTCTFTLIRNKTKSQIIVPQTISFTRQLTLQPNEILETSSEVDTLKDEMQRDMVSRILNVLNSQNVRKALEK
jgi:LPS-assembly lipoprotein